MLKKLFAAFLCAFLTHSISPCLAQQADLNTPSLTQVLPPAPNAYELTKYSGLPVNMSTGSVSTSIPLGAVNSGKANVPVSLEYNSGNGIQINQVAPRTGMSWSLKAGGVITRTVHDRPDELATYIVPPANPGVDNATVLTYLKAATNGVANEDTQADMFSFDFNGRSGQFFLNPTNKSEAIMMSSSALKVQTNFANETASGWSIKITDADGTKYFFGGPDATENSKTVTVGTGDDCGKKFDSPIPTAWYLVAVQHYNGEYISLKYKPLTFDYLANVSETIAGTPQDTKYLPTCTGDCPIRYDSKICVSKLNSSGVVLKSISSRYATVSFFYSGRSDFNGSDNKDSLLTSVKFYKKDVVDSTILTLYDTYNLSYIYSSNTSYYNPTLNEQNVSKRAFLTTVTRAGTAPQVYSMDYYNIDDLPSRLSFAQDNWGYFNHINNTHLIPQNADPVVAIAFPIATSNRYPDGNYAYYGLLRKITYPTKGTDELEYEGNTVWDTRATVPLRVSVSKEVTGTGFSGENYVTYPFTTGATQYIDFSFQCILNGTDFDFHQNAFFYILKASDGSVVYTKGPMAPGTSSDDLVLLTPPGDYILKVLAHGEAATAKAIMRYYRRAVPVQPIFRQVGYVWPAIYPHRM